MRMVLNTVLALCGLVVGAAFLGLMERVSSLERRLAAVEMSSPLSVPDAAAGVERLIDLVDRNHAACGVWVDDLDGRLKPIESGEWILGMGMDSPLYHELIRLGRRDMEFAGRIQNLEWVVD